MAARRTNVRSAAAYQSEWRPGGPYGALKKGTSPGLSAKGEVEPIGLEPTTSCMPCRRSPN